MNIRLIQGYLLGALVLIVLVAAAMLLLLNLGGTWQFHLYVEPVHVTPAGGMLIFGAAGIVVLLVAWKLLPRAVRALHEGSTLRHAKSTEKRVREMEKKDRPSA